MKPLKSPFFRLQKGAISTYKSQVNVKTAMKYFYQFIKDYFNGANLGK